MTSACGVRDVYLWGFELSTLVGPLPDLHPDQGLTRRPVSEGGPIRASFAPNHVEEDALLHASLWKDQHCVVTLPFPSLIIISITCGSVLWVHI